MNFGGFCYFFRFSFILFWFNKVMFCFIIYSRWYVKWVSMSWAFWYKRWVVWRNESFGPALKLFITWIQASELAGRTSVGALLKWLGPRLNVLGVEVREVAAGAATARLMTNRVFKRLLPDTRWHFTQRAMMHALAQ